MVAAGTLAVGLATLALASAPAVAHACVGARPARSAHAGLTADAHATVALAPRDPAGLASYAAAVSDPGSRLYHHFLTVAQFASRFGPSAAQVVRVRRALAARGLTAGPLAANRLALEVSGSEAGSGALGAAVARAGATAAGGVDGIGGVGAGSVGGLVAGVIDSGAPAPTPGAIIRTPRRGAGVGARALG
ncbi:MAG: protease pro-enzyme activation domain-containing protein, partial [Solirubrobacteraceae bacterium]